jgi:hypothetical protein
VVHLDQRDPGSSRIHQRRNFRAGSVDPLPHPQTVHRVDGFSDQYSPFHHGLDHDFNSIPLVLGAFLINLDAALYSIIYVFVSGSVMDRILASFNERRSVFIISAHSFEISQQILNKLHRGATLLTGRGAYTQSPLEIIYSVISLFELAKMKDMVTAIDPKAFLIINETQEVIGKGFDSPTSGM